MVVIASQSVGPLADAWPEQFVLLAIVGYLVVVGLASLTSTRVTRTRLERFAQRHHLEITPGNGNRVIAYLATTRRWRTTGLVAGLVVSLSWYAWRSPHAGSLQIRVDAVYLFVGWFGGALLAEARMVRGNLGPRRAASLEPRRASSYLPGWAWALVPAAAVATAAVTGVVEFAALRRGVTADPVLGWLVAALALAAVIRATQRHVLRRSQPVADPDITAADDAIRSRSLHVLAGGGVVLISYCALAQLSAIRLPGYDLDVRLRAAQMIGVYAVAVFGGVVATLTWPVQRRGPNRTGGPEPVVAMWTS
jgi:hypothetical protein